MSRKVYNIAVIGSGFGGSLMAMICQRLGRSVILLERGKHPRFAIGESSTPLTNLMLEDLAKRYDLPALTPLTKWGSWQEAYPGIACGLKRGFTFYHHVLGKPDADDPDHKNQLLVAASPNDRIADTHWYRPEFDEFFAMEAQRIGVEYLDEADLRSVSESENEMTLAGRRNGTDLEVRAKFVIDATGPRGFLHRSMNLPELAIPGLPETEALYSHFTGVKRYADVIGANGATPYPIDDAAVHHVFDGGWIWVLQFNNGVTSAGVAAKKEGASRLRLFEGAGAWSKLLALIPTLQEQFAGAEAIRPFTHVRRLSFRSGRASGRNWVQLPSAAGFIDPLLSTGFALTLLGINRLAEVIAHSWGLQEFDARVENVASECEAELLATGRLIGSLYESMSTVSVFTALSLLYFAAVIYSETARRLGRPELASSFLLHQDPQFGPACLRLFEGAKELRDGTDSKRLCEDIIRAIEPLNLAGLGDAHRRNWYPVDVRDLFRSAWKVGASPEEIKSLLDRSGFQLSPDLAMR